MLQQPLTQVAEAVTGEMRLNTHSVVKLTSDDMVKNGVVMSKRAENDSERCCV